MLVGHILDNFCHLGIIEYSSVQFCTCVFDTHLGGFWNINGIFIMVNKCAGDPGIPLQRPHQWQTEKNVSTAESDGPCEILVCGKHDNIENVY